MYFPSTTSFLFSLFFIFSCTNAFNITSMLKDHKDFSTFNDYLTRTKLAEEINNRQSLTVFVVDNGAISSLTGGNSLDTVKKVLSLHVALEYFDGPKLKNLPKDEPTILTTLLQANGQSTGQQGFLKATMGGDNGGGVGITISSASSPDQKATIGKSVTSQPYNISVIQISNAIVPNIISPPTGAPTKLPSPPPSKSPKSPKTLPGEGSPDLAPGGSGTVDGPTTAASPDSPSSSAGTKMVSVTFAFVISVAALMCTNLLLVRLP